MTKPKKATKAVKKKLIVEAEEPITHNSVIHELEPPVLEFEPTKTVHGYNPTTGEYIGPQTAFIDQMQPGEYIMPANTTDEWPPKPKAGHVVKWNGSTWEQAKIQEPEVEEIDEAAEAHAAAVKRRNKLLGGCDWTQLADSPLSKAERQAWADYRQALRDLPTAPGFPEVEWPTAPNS
jgi:hypothetical protein